jgi:glucose/arabinose dehydrogenase/mono/diheme cytochrome c family protein
MKKYLIALIVLVIVILALYGINRDETPLYQSIDTPPAPALTPEQAFKSFTIADEFSIELVAAEPLVVDPVAMAWDAAGRLFVVEMRGFMPDANGEGEDQPVGRVVMLLDDDADGVMDRSEVFLDGLVMPRAVAVVNEGLLVGEPPNLWLCPDIDGKTRCENRRLVGDYAADYQTVSMEHLENGLMLGLDNWLYNAKSDRRFRFVNGQLQVEKTLARGQWGIAQDNQGRLYYNTNSNFLSGDYFPAHTNDGASQGLSEQITDNDEVFSIRVNPGVNRAYLDGVLRKDGRLKSPTAVSGLAVYRGGQFPEVFWQDVFVPEPAANAVVQLRAKLDEFAVSADHITYPDKQWGKREFFASSDERFRPVDLKVGPDGALYVIDMYRGIIQHKEFLTDELRQQILERGLDKPLGQGRIWRIVHKESRRLSVPDISRATVPALIELLNNDIAWLRETAQRLLTERPDAVKALREIVAQGKPLAAVHSLWALEGLGALDRETLASALERSDSNIAQQSLRAGRALINQEMLLGISDQLLQDTSTALAWLDSLAQFNHDGPVQSVLLSQLLTQGHNVYRREAVVRSSRGVELTMIAGVLGSELLQLDTDGSDILEDLVASAYLSEIESPDVAKASLATLLQTIATLDGDKQWQQMAMLAGLTRAAQQVDSPLVLQNAPRIFMDKSLAGDDPLWIARIAARKAFTWAGDELAYGRIPLTGEQTTLLEKGKAIYQHCATCHGDKGQGVAGLAPELAGSEWVTGPVEWLARIVLDGMQGEIEVNGKVWNGVMPPHRHFSGLDAEGLTGLLIHLRRLGSNHASAPSLQQVNEIIALPPRSKPWTTADIREVPYATSLDKFIGQYKISFVTFTVTVVNGKLLVEVPMYGTSVLEEIEEGRFAAGKDGETLGFRFGTNNLGEIDALYIVRGLDENRAEKIK